MVNLKTKTNSIFFKMNHFLIIQFKQQNTLKNSIHFYKFQTIIYNYALCITFNLCLPQCFSLLLSISVTGQAYSSVKETKVCFLIPACSLEPRGSHLLVLLAMRHGLKTNTQSSTRIKGNIIIGYRVGATARFRYLVCPTSNGRDSVLHQPSMLHQR